MHKSKDNKGRKIRLIN